MLIDDFNLQNFEEAPIKGGNFPVNSWQAALRRGDS
jgi:hypothetical protein